ncbi:MAG: N-acetylglucosamine-6-phosphate deacetylase [Clostridia bacterium]
MLLKNCKVFDGISFIKDIMDIRISNDIISSLTLSSNRTSIDDTDTKDMTGYILTPGFIDIHTHGIEGFDLCYSDDCDPEEFIYEYVKKGTTSVLPSTIALKTDKIRKILLRYSDVRCPAFLGIHLEGPFLNTKKAGAHKVENIQLPTIDAYNEIVGDHSNLIKRITIAPESDTDFALAEYLTKKDILVSFGHTECSSEMAYIAFRHGYILSTHQFNAMPQMHHREVYITGAALLDDDVYCEYIPDLHHVCTDMLKVLFKCKPIDKLIMVTDSLSPSGMKDGKYNLGDIDIYVVSGKILTANGVIAGSSITCAEGVQRMIDAGFEPKTVLRSVTSNPAHIMHLKDRGRIKEGYKADINIFSKDYSIKNTIFHGKSIF